MRAFNTSCRGKDRGRNSSSSSTCSYSVMKSSSSNFTSRKVEMVNIVNGEDLRAMKESLKASGLYRVSTRSAPIRQNLRS